MGGGGLYRYFLFEGKQVALEQWFILGGAMCHWQILFWKSLEFVVVHGLGHVNVLTCPAKLFSCPEEFLLSTFTILSNTCTRNIKVQQFCVLCYFMCHNLEILLRSQGLILVQHDKKKNCSGQWDIDFFSPWQICRSWSKYMTWLITRSGLVGKC